MTGITKGTSSIASKTGENVAGRPMTPRHYTDYAKESCLYMSNDRLLDPKKGSGIPIYLGYPRTIHLHEDELETKLVCSKGMMTIYTNLKAPQKHDWFFDSGEDFMESVQVYRFSEIKKSTDEKDQIEEAIEVASYIPSLEPNWDDEGAVPVSEATFTASINFLREYADYLKSSQQVQILPPEINPCKDGSIDLEWHTHNARLLINIRPKDGEYHAFYYGDKYNNKMQVKGSVPLSEFSESLAVWMKYLV